MCFCQMCRILEVIIRNYKNVQTNEQDLYNRRSLAEEIESEEGGAREDDEENPSLFYQHVQNSKF